MQQSPGSGRSRAEHDGQVQKNWQASIGISSSDRASHSGQVIVARVTTADTRCSVPLAAAASGASAWTPTVVSSYQ
jgi:hypothetical protein